MEIQYPKDWKKTKLQPRFNSEEIGLNHRIAFRKSTRNGFEETSDVNYVNGYRRAIKDVKRIK